MKGPLVDNEGYPRSDIDVYAVRQARNKIISESLWCLMSSGFDPVFHHCTCVGVACSLTDCDQT